MNCVLSYSSRIFSLFVWLLKVTAMSEVWKTCTETMEELLTNSALLTNIATIQTETLVHCQSEQILKSIKQISLHLSPTHQYQ